MGFDNKQQIREFYLLIEQAVEGDANEQLANKLDELLKNDPDARRYYIEYLLVHSELRQVLEISQGDLFTEINGGISLVPVDSPELWEALAEAEDTASAVDVDIKMRQGAERLISQPEIKHKSRNYKLPIISALAAAAVIVLFLTALIMNRTGRNDEFRPVATLTDTARAVWAGNSQVDEGQRLSGYSLLHLLEGYAEVTFDNGAKTVIEGPAKFVCESTGSIFIEKGKIYAKINKASVGFTVNTSYARIVDLGTEFGIDVDEGESELYVYEGKVKLLSQNNQAGHWQSEDVSENQAIRVNSSDDTIEKISFSQTLFKKQIPSEYELAVLAEKPLYYWRYDHSRSKALANSIDGQYGIGTCKQEPQFTQGPLFRPDQINNALIVNRGQYVEVIDEVFQQINTKRPYTYITWVKINENVSGDIIVTAKCKDGELRNTRRFFINKDGKFVVQHHNYLKPKLSKLAITSQTIAEKNKWYMVAWTSGWKTDHVRRMYVNGNLETSFPSTHLKISQQNTSLYNDKIYIGSPPGQTHSQSFVGMIDETAIFDYDLTSDQIKQLYDVAIKNGERLSY